MPLILLLTIPSPKNGAWCFGCCQAHRGLPVVNLLLRYYVYVLLSPYLCFLSIIFLDLYVIGDDAWIVRGLSCKPNIYVSWSTSELRVRLAPWNRFKQFQMELCHLLLTIPSPKNRAWCFGCRQAHRGLPVVNLLLRYYVLCTVESVSLLSIHYISWFICSRRWCMDS